MIGEAIQREIMPLLEAVADVHKKDGPALLAALLPEQAPETETREALLERTRLVLGALLLTHPLTERDGEECRNNLTLFDLPIGGKHTPGLQDILLDLVRAGANPLAGQRSRTELLLDDWRSLLGPLTHLMSDLEREQGLAYRSPLADNMLHLLARTPAAMGAVMDYDQNHAPDGVSLIPSHWWQARNERDATPASTLWDQLWVIEIGEAAANNTAQQWRGMGRIAAFDEPEADRRRITRSHERWQWMARALYLDGTLDHTNGLTPVPIIMASLSAGLALPPSCQDIWATMVQGQLDQNTDPAGGGVRGPRL